MNKKGSIVRFGKYAMFSLAGTVTDILVIWLFSHLVFPEWKLVQSVFSTMLATECQIIVTFIVSAMFVWGDIMKGKRKRAKFGHFLAFNASFVVVFFFKYFIQLFFAKDIGLDVVLAELIALTISGVLNFLMNNYIIFKKKNDQIVVGLDSIPGENRKNDE